MDKRNVWGEELQGILQNVPFSEVTKEFLEECFRVRIKLRDTGSYTFQARHEIVEDSLKLDLSSIAKEISLLMKDWDFDEIILEYKDCCCEGCKGCRRFTGEK